MSLFRFTRRATFVAAAAAMVAGVAAAPASAHSSLGTRSLAAVLTADKSGFDRNGADFDILTAAVLAVLKAKPNSPVKVLTDGKTALTAFVPTDTAFRRLVADIQGKKKLPTEKQAFTAAAGLGINTVESILLYHVVPGSTIDKKAALKADGARLATATGAKIKVDVYGCWWARKIQLVDADRNDANARIVSFNINKGNRQIAHAVNQVLRPSDLP